MTKAIRIENADTAPCEVVVEVWQKNYENLAEPDKLLEVLELTYPTAMLTEYIHDSQYLVIRES